MTRRTSAFAVSVACAALGSGSCGPAPGPESDLARQVVQVPDGDAARGKEAFVKSGCTACHRVEGRDLPPPVADPPTAVTLAAEWDPAWTAQQITTAIIAPCYEISEAYGSQVKSGDQSRMGQNLHVEVGQLLDIVAFLREANRDVLAAKRR